MENYYDQMDDDQLLLAFQQNKNELALKALVSRHKKNFFKLCHSLTLDKEIAEDLLQESWIKATSFIQKDKYLYQGNFIAWMRKIVVNSFIDMNRASKRKFKMIYCEDVEHLVPKNWHTPEAVYLDKEIRFFIELLIEQFDDRRIMPQFKQCLKMRFLDGYLLVEIAEKLDVNLSTIKTWVRSGKAYLQADKQLRVA